EVAGIVGEAHLHGRAERRAPGGRARREDGGARRVVAEEDEGERARVVDAEHRVRAAPHGRGDVRGRGPRLPTVLGERIADGEGTRALRLLGPRDGDGAIGRDRNGGLELVLAGSAGGDDTRVEGRGAALAAAGPAGGARRGGGGVAAGAGGGDEDESGKDE